MFSKGFFVFGLLAIFACQGATPSIGDLIKQISEVITSLNNMVSGVIGDALKVLGNFASTISELEKQVLDQGYNIINNGIGNVVEFINNKTQEATELGVDIGECFVGRNEQLQQLVSGLRDSLTACVTTTVGSALTMVNNDIKIISQIVGNVTNIPVKLSKCLISLRPISCVTNLVSDVTKLVANLPGQITGIVNEATKLVDDLSAQLAGCVTNIASTTTSQTEAIIVDIGTCVDNIIRGNSTVAS